MAATADAARAGLYEEAGVLADRERAVRARGRISWRARARRYFRPLRVRAYYSALFHLLVLNFPYALLAWVYLFVFTLVSPLPVCGASRGHC